MTIAVGDGTVDDLAVAIGNHRRGILEDGCLSQWMTAAVDDRRNR